MKQNFFLLTLIVFGVITSCNTKNNNNEETPIAGTDSSLMGTDNTNVATAPTTDTVTTATTANLNPSKKGKKGKVTITLPAAGTGEMTPDKEGYYTNTEILPTFPGGQKALENFPAVEAAPLVLFMNFPRCCGCPLKKYTGRSIPLP